MTKQTKTLLWVAAIGISGYFLWKNFSKPCKCKQKPCNCNGNKKDESEAKLSLTAGGCPPGQHQAVVTVETDHGYIDEVTGERVGVKTKKVVMCVPNNQAV